MNAILEEQRKYHNKHQQNVPQSPQNQNNNRNQNDLQLLKPKPIGDELMKSFEQSMTAVSKSNGMSSHRLNFLKSKMKMVPQLILKQKNMLESKSKHTPLNPAEQSKLSELRTICDQMKKQTLTISEIARLSILDNLEISFKRKDLEVQSKQQKEAYREKVEEIEHIQKQMEEGRIKAIMEEKLRQAELQMQEAEQVRECQKMAKEVKKKEKEIIAAKKDLEKEKHKVSVQKQEIMLKKKLKLQEEKKEIQKEMVNDPISNSPDKGKSENTDEKKEPQQDKSKSEEKKGWFGGMFSKKEESNDFLDSSNNAKYKAKETKRIKLPFSNSFQV